MKKQSLFLFGWLLLATPVAVQAQFSYSTNNGTITITVYYGPGGAVSIPSQINGLPVTAIGDGAFRGTGLTSVTIPNSVTSIGYQAFYDCTNLTSVTIPDSVTIIGALPDTVTSILGLAFGGCTSLTAISVETNNPAYSSVSGVLFDKSQTTLIEYPGGKVGSYSIPNSVTSIGTFAFESWGLTSVTIPNSVTTIGDFAFSGCWRLATVNIPNSVTTIGSSVFAGCSSLTDVTIPNSVASIGDYAFEYCESLTNVTISASVTNIGNYMFYFCNLTSVTIPNSVTSIGMGAFGWCKSLTSVTILNGVGFIGMTAFAACTSLTSITIPNSVTSIGWRGFEYCSSLTNVTIGSGATNISEAFVDCTSLTAISVETNNPSYSSLEGVLFDKSQTTLIEYPGGKVGSYSIPNSVTSIAYKAFSGGCTSLTNVSIPNSFTNLDHNAFGECTSLTAINVETNNPAYSSVSGVLFNQSQTTLIIFHEGKVGSYSIPNSVTKIGDDAFAGCSSLASVSIPNSVTTIGSDAFAGCSSLTDVTIPNRITSIGHDAFAYCTSLTNVTIPKSLTSIGDHAFTGCSSLALVYFQGNAPRLGAYVFGWGPGMPFVNATAYYLPGRTGWGSSFGGIPTALWLPQAQVTDTSFGVKTNQFGFKLTWVDGLSVVVEASPRLSNPVWSPVATNTLLGGSFYFTDPQWTNYPTRFYRVHSQ
jgi:hypothetical protein